MRTLDLFRPSVGAFAVGMAQAALDAAVAHVTTREAFGRTLSQLQGVSHQLADVATAVQAARLLVHSAASAYDHGVRPTTKAAAMAKLFATETAQRAIDVAHPGPRRTRPRGGPHPRAPLPRGPRDAHLRGCLGDPARDHRPPALPRRRVSRAGERFARPGPSLGVMATVTLEDRAAALLADLAGPDATFRPHQLEAMRDLVEDRARVLCVQRTGWGKSAVYFIATALLRERGAGPTLIVSPLLALMRNQIAAAERLGIRAHTINSTNRDAWEEVQRLLAEDAVDLLLISPERLNNPQFRDAMLPLFVERVGLLVVDEAHCISDWGHDFRPDYRRLAEVLERLPGGRRRCCARRRRPTIASWPTWRSSCALGHAGDAASTYRGPLGRSSLRLEVVDLPGPGGSARVAGDVAAAARGLGHRLHADQARRRARRRVADRARRRGRGLQRRGGRRDGGWRRRGAVARQRAQGGRRHERARDGLRQARPRLRRPLPGAGLGHLLLPAGRAAPAAPWSTRTSCCCAARRTSRIQDFFIEQAFPPRELVERVLEALETRGRGDAARRSSRTSTSGAAGSRRCSRCSTSRVRWSGAARTWGGAAGSDWTYDAERYAEVTALRRSEQAAMAAFGADGRCLMRALQEELDDPDPQDCGRCAVCAGPRFAEPLDPELVRAASAAPALEAAACSRSRRWRRTRTGRCASSPTTCAPRRAARSRAWATAAGIPRCRRVGAPGASTTSSSSRRPSWCAAGRRRAARAGSRPCRRRAAARWCRTSPQRLAAAARAAVRGCRGARAKTGRPSARWPTRSSRSPTCAAPSRVREPLPDGPCLLVDDLRFSGWTLAMLAGQLRRNGVPAVYPLALATAF